MKIERVETKWLMFSEPLPKLLPSVGISKFIRSRGGLSAFMCRSKCCCFTRHALTPVARSIRLPLHQLHPALPAPPYAILHKPRLLRGVVARGAETQDGLALYVHWSLPYRRHTATPCGPITTTYSPPSIRTISTCAPEVVCAICCSAVVGLPLMRQTTKPAVPTNAATSIVIASHGKRFSITHSKIRPPMFIHRLACQFTSDRRSRE